MRFQIRNKASALSLLLAIMLFITACSGSGSSSGGSTTVNVTMTDFAFQSSTTTFQTGVSYHFVVTNKGSVAHQFVIMPVMSNPSNDQVNSAKLAGIEGDGIKAGGSDNFDYTFKEAAPSGKLEFACHLPGHYDAGMHMAITVQ
jgi:uncharacterized cupredoxin-like copper-binding protein